jgi:hypothetical protein
LFEILLTKLKLYRKIYIAECKFGGKEAVSCDERKKTCSIVIGKQSDTMNFGIQEYKQLLFVSLSL